MYAHISLVYAHEILGKFGLYFLNGSHFSFLFSNNKYCIFSFSGFGWYLDKVHIKDKGAGMQYFVQCDRWLSSREGDGRTFKDFNITDSMTYNPGSTFNKNMSA